MLNQLIKLVRLNADETILKNPAVPQEHKEAAVTEAAHQIFGGLQKQMKRDRLASVAITLQASGLYCDPTVKQVMGYSPQASPLNSEYQHRHHNKSQVPCFHVC